MTAIYTDLIVEQGTSFITTIELKDVNGASFNLVNYSASSLIKKSYYSIATPTPFSIYITPPEANGVIVMTLTKAATANLSPGKYVYDVIISNTLDPANTTTRVVEGSVLVTPGVTF